MCEKEVAKDNNKIKGISKRKLYLNLLNENINDWNPSTSFYGTLNFKNFINFADGGIGLA